MAWIDFKYAYILKPALVTYVAKLGTTRRVALEKRPNDVGRLYRQGRREGGLGGGGGGADPGARAARLISFLCFFFVWLLFRFEHMRRRNKIVYVPCGIEWINHVPYIIS